MEQQEFAALWAYLGAAYPGRQAFAEEATAEVFWRQLADLPADALMHAVTLYVDSDRHPPTVADLRTEAKAIIAQRAPSRLRQLEPRPVDDRVRTQRWYITLQQRRQQEGKPAGHPLVEDKDLVREECKARGIEIDYWPAVPKWYGKLNVAGEDDVNHRVECPQWLIAEFEQRGDSAIVPTYMPCGVCLPGRRAVFDAQLHHARWLEEEDAVRVYVRAEVDAGRTVVPYVGAGRGVESMWRRIIKDRGGDL